MAVNEIIQRLQGFRGPDGSWNERVRQFHATKDFDIRAAGRRRDGCPICNSNRYWGRGDMEPFLDQSLNSESALSNYLVSKRLLFPRVRYAIVNWGFIANPELVVTYVDDHPTKEELRHGELDVVMSGPYPKWAVFLCPCGCGDAIDISIAKGAKSWQLEVDPIGRPSLYPSVWRHDRCLSHFWVRRGEVFWCKSLGQSASSPATGRTGRIRKLGNWIRSRVWPG